MSTVTLLPDPVPAPAVDPMVPAVGTVRRRRRDGPAIWTLDIETGDDAVGPGLPGQFNMLTAFGVGEVPISLSGDPASPQPFIHTVRAVGPVSSALAALRAGEPVGVRGPYGTGWPLDAADGKDVLLIAGGLGLAPLRPALYRLLAARERYGRVVLLYGTRSPDDMVYRRELEEWRARFDLEVEVTVDHAPPGWHGHIGVVTRLIQRASFDPEQTVAFVCGPEVMMRFTAASLLAEGVAEEGIYLSMERNMKCAIGFCGHCQFGPTFVCRDGPVFPYTRIKGLIGLKEI